MGKSKLQYKSLKYRHGNIFTYTMGKWARFIGATQKRSG